MHPIMPLNIVEATYLVPPPLMALSRTELIVQRAIALQKRTEQLVEIHSQVYEAHREAARRFK